MLFNFSNFGGEGKVLCYIKNAGGLNFQTENIKVHGKNVLSKILKINILI